MLNTIATIILTILIVFHLPIAFFASKELNDYPIWNKNKKIKWLFIVWLLPIIGSVIVQKKIHLERSGSETTGGTMLARMGPRMQEWGHKNGVRSCLLPFSHVRLNQWQDP